MKEDEFTELRNKANIPSLEAKSCLKDLTPRTLIWGFDCERNSFHVYLDFDQTINVVRYDNATNVVSVKLESDGIKPGMCIPDKRVYPEACDAEFCAVLKDAGISIPFTSYNRDRKIDGVSFHGLMSDELTYPSVRNI